MPWEERVSKRRGGGSGKPKGTPGEVRRGGRSEAASWTQQGGGEDTKSLGG